MVAATGEVDSEGEEKTGKIGTKKAKKLAAKAEKKEQREVGLLLHVRQKREGDR